MNNELLEYGALLILIVPALIYAYIAIRDKKVYEKRQKKKLAYKTFNFNLSSISGISVFNSL